MINIIDPWTMGLRCLVSNIDSTKVQIQVDSIGAMTQLSEDAFSGQHVGGLSTGGDNDWRFFEITLAI